MTSPFTSKTRRSLRTVIMVLTVATLTLPAAAHADAFGLRKAPSSAAQTLGTNPATEARLPAVTPAAAKRATHAAKR